MIMDYANSGQREMGLYIPTCFSIFELEEFTIMCLVPLPMVAGQVGELPKEELPFLVGPM